MEFLEIDDARCLNQKNLNSFYFIVRKKAFACVFIILLSKQR